ncbi:MAG: hypothetical protein B7733_08495 [Myxococcales bacterium FL481]|nr:MAG: hypothetical protein B7733_08495 [Myxococcales bacterium FL481]
MAGQHWIRVDASYDRHPDMIEAGFEASVVFERLLRICKLFGKSGEIPRKFWTARFLAAHCGMPDAFARAGLAQLAAQAESAAAEGEEGLTTVQPDGSLAINGWARFNGDRTNAARQQRWRDRQREGDAVTEQPSGVTHKRYVTQSNAVTTTPHHTTPRNTTTPPTPPERGEAKPRGGSQKAQPITDGQVEAAKARLAEALGGASQRQLVERLASARAESNKTGRVTNGALVNGLLGPIEAELAKRIHPPAAWAYAIEQALAQGKGHVLGYIKACVGSYRPPQRKSAELDRDRPGIDGRPKIVASNPRAQKLIEDLARGKAVGSA